jgi:hypothetical protein
MLMCACAGLALSALTVTSADSTTIDKFNLDIGNLSPAPGCLLSRVA